LTPWIQRLADFILIKYLISKENNVEFHPFPSATFIKDQNDIYIINQLYKQITELQGDKGILYQNEEDRVMSIVKNIMMNSKSKIPNFDTTFEAINSKIEQLSSNQTFRTSTITINPQQVTKPIVEEKPVKVEQKVEPVIPTIVPVATKPFHTEIVEKKVEEKQEKKQLWSDYPSGSPGPEETKVIEKKEEKSIPEKQENQKIDEEEQEDDFNIVGKKDTGFKGRGQGRDQGFRRGRKRGGDNFRRGDNFRGGRRGRNARGNTGDE